MSLQQTFGLHLLFRISLSTSLQNQKTYLYFAYGSDLLTERIHRDTGAIRAGIGKLKCHRLDFHFYRNLWHGYVATIVQDDNHEVWGALWNITENDLYNLDRQEGSDHNMYFRFLVRVERPDNVSVNCLTYQLANSLATYFPLDKLPENRQPSKAYLNTIIKGAEESGLPSQYQQMLKNIAHNEYDGDVFHNIH
ncbi:hypothetical protein RI129_010795 [Pyrocoelia pectoralis]|uniref:gamma-glutamylcyclotransferase n=1 Tax=Pyrocoelia pectoralis TaxID=417401 RepID=A0AAN7V4Y1_9COLE